jgi:hypothetical protein
MVLSHRLRSIDRSASGEFNLVGRSRPRADPSGFPDSRKLECRELALLNSKGDFDHSRFVRFQRPFAQISLFFCKRAPMWHWLGGENTVIATSSATSVGKAIRRADGGNCFWCRSSFFSSSPSRLACTTRHAVFSAWAFARRGKRDGCRRLGAYSARSVVLIICA